MSTISELFGTMVFNEQVMKERLPLDTYRALKQTVAHGLPLDLELANVIAEVMKDWAIEKGATHFTHWFQPMTGVTAEKHDSFIQPGKNGSVEMSFSGKSLVKGEPDASSFPSGGLRATFEARGYTAWDPTSYAFIKDNTLCIPTAFCSYSGEALDKKTPLLRSMEALERQVSRIVRLFPDEGIRYVFTTVGAEQEYFLIDKDVYRKRPDLLYCGRTLFGARPPKGQELDDHYYGAIKPRVLAFMKELDEELWKLGVLAKTEHNEVAPGQHELAPIFTKTNIAVDHNQLTMEMLKRIADRHGMVCLLHEKPFAGVSGSGKHNNWSINADNGENLFDPGKTPAQNQRFLLILAAVLKAADVYQDLLRVSVAGAGNDHRLGANEAPPTILSVFLGEELTAILESIARNAGYVAQERGRLNSGAAVLPTFTRDTTDRNRTSPFAFTGNKFELRIPGSSASVSDPNVILNTATADVLGEFADRLEKADDFPAALEALIRETIVAHRRIVFNGNNYAEEWTREAEARGLLNLRHTVDAVPHLIAQKNIDLFARQGVYRENELRARHDIYLENYCKTIHIEALTMIDMTRRGILPAVIRYQRELAETIAAKSVLGVEPETETERRLLDKISHLCGALYKKLGELETAASKTNSEDIVQAARFCHDVVFADMNALRALADELEMLLPARDWPYPSYAEILYSVQ